MGFPIANTFGKISRLLSTGTISGVSLALFQQYHEKIQFFQFQFETNTTLGSTGFDGNNSLSFDNIQFLSISNSLVSSRVTSITAINPDQLSLTSTALQGHLYEIHQSKNLLNFNPIGDIDASGASTIFTRTQTLVSSKFFKVEDVGTT